MTKSSMSLFGKVIVSCTVSFHDVSPCTSGILKRITNGMFAATRFATSAASSLWQRRSYLNASLPAVASFAHCLEFGGGAEAAVRGAGRRASRCASR